MGTKIKVLIGEQEFEGTLNDSDTASALATRLPLTVSMSRWGDEYYGDIGELLGVSPAPDARDEMKIGELAYWLPGNALCIFFGRTPASVGDEPRAASCVNPVGEIVGDLSVLKSMPSAVSVKIGATE